MVYSVSRHRISARFQREAVCMDEMKKAIAFLFKRKGRENMSDKDFVMSASMDLRWFPPKDAQRLLQAGLDLKLLVSEEGKIRPAFDVTGIELPIDYSPPPTILQVEALAQSVFNKIIDRITKASNLEKRQIVSLINTTQDNLDVEVEVAALIVGKEMGVDVSDLLKQTEDEVASRLR